MSRLVQPGRLIPVCCVADVSTEAKDRFLQLNVDFEDQGEHFFVFVESLTATYDSESQISENTPTSTSSPFKNKGPEECSRLLQQIQSQAGSDIDHEHLVVFDDRSLRDDTVLMVEKEILTEGEEASDVSVRVVSEMANFEFLVYISGKADMAEDYEKAQRTEDKVLRSPYELL